MKKLKGGFTLLELLVVIGIIAMLVGIGAVNYSAAQKRSRDARRRLDIKTIRQAMETAYGGGATYVYPSCSMGVAITAGNCAVGSYVEGGVVPTDPGTTSYTFTSSSATAYTVCATLEAGGSFCLSNLQ